MFKKLKEVQYSWGIQDSGERVRAEVSQGRGKRLGIVLMAMGSHEKWEGIKQRNAWSYMHTWLLAPALWPNQSICPVISLYPWGKRYWAPTTMDARDRNRVSTFRNNIPPPSRSTVLHDFASANLEKPRSCPLRGTNIGSGKWSPSLLCNPGPTSRSFDTKKRTLATVQCSVLHLIKSSCYLPSCILLFHCLCSCFPLQLRIPIFPLKVQFVFIILKHLLSGNIVQYRPQGLCSLTQDPQPWRCGQLATFNNPIRW